MTIHVKEQWQIRHATKADIPAIVEMVNTCARALTGEPSTEADEVAHFLDSPVVNPTTDTWVVFTPDDQLVGFAGLSDRAPHVNLWTWADVHPDYVGCGIGSELIRRAEARARESIALAPPNARVTLFRGINEKEHAARRLFAAHGYTLIRHSWRMRIELDAAPPAPIFPAGVRMRTVDASGEAATVFRTVDDCFKDHWGHVDDPDENGIERYQHHIDTHPNFDPTLWFLAVKDTPDGEEIAGLTLCDPRMVSDPDMAYIATLGVKRDWRRQGLGLAMLHHVFGEFYRRGIPRAALHVDAESLTGATRLYEKAGMHVDRHYEQFEKELRPGEVLMTQTID